jgi:apolipoprotein N-acyltransferase
VETAYDWLTIMIFAGLVVLFMQRSTSGAPQDSLWQYLTASVGCAAANWLGNQAITQGNLLFHAAALGVLVATLIFVALVLRPFQRS